MAGLNDAVASFMHNLSRKVSVNWTAREATLMGPKNDWFKTDDGKRVKADKLFWWYKLAFKEAIFWVFKRYWSDYNTVDVTDQKAIEKHLVEVAIRVIQNQNIVKTPAVYKHVNFTAVHNLVPHDIQKDNAWLADAYAGRLWEKAYNKEQERLRDEAEKESDRLAWAETNRRIKERLAEEARIKEQKE